MPETSTGVKFAETNRTVHDRRLLAEQSVSQRKTREREHMRSVRSLSKTQGYALLYGREFSIRKAPLWFDGLQLVNPVKARR